MMLAIFNNIKLFNSIKITRKSSISSFQFHHAHLLGNFHGLPGVPDDTVVRLPNSTLCGELYLIGTVHISERSAETVKKVINLVKPDVVAIELCNNRALSLKQSKSRTDNLFKIFRDSIKASGGLSMKLATFYRRLWHHRLRVVGVYPGKDFQVAMEECERSKAQLVLIDEDVNVLLRKLFSEYYNWPFHSLKGLIRATYRLYKITPSLGKIEEVANRAFAQRIVDIWKTETPELMRMIITERDLLMFSRLRSLKGKVVGVVGLGHMDGIERLWKQAEDNHFQALQTRSEDAEKPS